MQRRYLDGDCLTRRAWLVRPSGSSNAGAQEHGTWPTVSRPTPSSARPPSRVERTSTGTTETRCRCVVQNESQSIDDSLRGKEAANRRGSPDQAPRADALDVLHCL